MLVKRLAIDLGTANSLVWLAPLELLPDTRLTACALRHVIDRACATTGKGGLEC